MHTGIPSDWLDDESMCKQHLTLWAKLASGPRCFKEQWAGFNVKFSINPKSPEKAPNIIVQILTDTLKGSQQFQEVPKSSLLPHHPQYAKQTALVFSGPGKGSLGSVVRIEGNTATLGPLKGRANAKNIVQHEVNRLVIAAVR